MFHNRHASIGLKLTDKWSIYLPTYQRLLSPHVSQPWRILEIGVQNGGSLEVWSHSFPHATHIVGCDIDPACSSLTFEDPRIAVVVGDANTDATEQAIARIAAQFDLIVDDGSHRSSDIVKSFARYFPRLADDGLYVAEDLHCSYWAAYEGGVLHPTSSVAFFKRLADVVNHEHWGVPNRRSDLFALFASQYGMTLDEDLLAHVHSVEFINSICVVRRRAPAENVLGKRVVLGTAASVEDEPRALHGTVHSAPDQTANPWSVLAPLPELELPALRTRSKQLADDIQARIARQEAEQARLEALLQPHQPHSNAQPVALESRIQQIVSDLASAQQNLAERAGDLIRARHHILRLRDRLANGGSQSRDLSRALMVERDALRETGNRLLQTEQRLHEIEGSRWWRAGAPLRALAQLDHRLSRVTHRMARVAAHEGSVGSMLRSCGRALARSGIGGLRGYLRTTDALVMRASNPAPAEGLDDRVGCEVFDRQQNEFSPAEIEQQFKAFSFKPLISVVMLGLDLPTHCMERSIESLLSQAYPNWELCFPDATQAPSEVNHLLAEYSLVDERIRIGSSDTVGGAAGNLQAAARMAHGPWVALLEAGDTLTHDALHSIVRAMNEAPQAQLLYSDECGFDDSSGRGLTRFVFKPGAGSTAADDPAWPGRLAVHEAAILKAVAGSSDEAGVGIEQLLADCARRQARHVVHVKRVLYLNHGGAGSDQRSIERPALRPSVIYP